MTSSLNLPQRDVKRVVIAGGGYAGVRLAHELLRADVPFDVRVISDESYHLQTPALYEAATAFMPKETAQASEMISASVAVPLKQIFRNQSGIIVNGKVAHVDPAERQVFFDEKGSMSFDLLALCLGAKLNTYNIPGVEEYTYNVKDLSSSLILRHHVASRFFMARDLPARQARQMLTFCVIGGGAAGVETAAELAGHIRKQVQKHGIDKELAQVILVEAGDFILRELDDRWRGVAVKRLLDLGVNILTSRRVTAVKEREVIFGDEKTSIEADTIIWAGGLKAHEVLVRSGLPVQGRGVLVDETLRVKGLPHVFAAGDCAVIEGKDAIPATAPVAYTQAALVAGNIERQAQGQPLKRYRYDNPGAVIALGGRYAIALMPSGGGVAGWLGWMIKQLIYLRYWIRLVSLGQAVKFWLRSLRLHTRND